MIAIDKGEGVHYEVSSKMTLEDCLSYLDDLLANLKYTLI